MKQQDLLDLNAASDVAVFERELVRVAGAMDFGLVSAALAVERPGRDPLFRMIGNTPAQFLAASRDQDQVRRDPVVQNMRRLSVPFVYDRSTYVNASADDLWEDQAHYGYHTGIAVALHLQAGRHFLLGMDRDVALPDDETRMMRLLADLHLLAVYAQDAAVRLLADADATPKPHITPREREVLLWTSQGKTAAEAGQIMGISARAAEFHIRNVSRKLGAPNKHAAVAHALALGILY